MMNRTVILAMVFIVAGASAVLVAGYGSGTVERGKAIAEGSGNYVPEAPTDDDVYCLLLANSYSDLTATAQDFADNMYGLAFDIFDCVTVTPTIDQLQAYDVVLLFENGIFANAPNVGAVIYDYVTNYDGRVVFATFVWQDWSTWPAGYGWGLMEGICPLIEAGGCEYNYDELDPGSIVPHAVTAGVTSLWCTSFHGGTAMQPGATGLARWSDQTPAMAYDATTGGRMVAISIFPAYENHGNYGIDFGGDFHRVFENALKWAAGMPSVTINLVPDAVFYHPGGTLGYTAILANQTDVAQTFWGKVVADVPGIGQVEVISPRPVTLGPGAYIEKHMAHPIPMAAPLGTYAATAMIGQPPDDLWDQDTFQFEMVP